MSIGDRITIFLATLTASRAVFFGMIITTLYYFLVFDDASGLRSQIAQNHESIKELNKQIQMTKEAVENANKFELEVKAAVDQFGQIAEYMPERMNSVEMTTLLTDLATRAGLRLQRTEPQRGSEKTDFYDTANLGISLEGSFSQIVTFLSLISQVPKFFTFKNMELIPIDGSDPEFPKLLLSGTIVGYRYLREQPPDKNEASGGK